MLGVDAQTRVREALRKSDRALEADQEIENRLAQQSQNFRDILFAAFQYVENESLQLQNILVKCSRFDMNQLQVQVKDRAAFILYLDAEFAYDRKQLTKPIGQSAESHPQANVELAARCFAALIPPLQGLLRYYTIFADGSWKRTTFTATANNFHAHGSMVPRFNPEILVMEAADLVGEACLLHPTWAGLAQDADNLTIEKLRDRNQVKTLLTGLGAPKTSR